LFASLTVLTHTPPHPVGNEASHAQAPPVHVWFTPHGPHAAPAVAVPHIAVVSPAAVSHVLPLQQPLHEAASH
jgi:hypothetical protein